MKNETDRNSKDYLMIFPEDSWFQYRNNILNDSARTYLQLPLQQWGAGNVYLLVLSSWNVNIAKIPIAGMGL